MARALQGRAALEVDVAHEPELPGGVSQGGQLPANLIPVFAAVGRDVRDDLPDFVRPLLPRRLYIAVEVARRQGPNEFREARHFGKPERPQCLQIDQLRFDPREIEGFLPSTMRPQD